MEPNNQKITKEQRALGSNIDMIRFNINGYIKVKLFDKGYQRLVDINNSYCNVVSNWRQIDVEYYKQQADKKGYTRFQMWDFIEKFGEVTYLGMDYYDVEILIERKGIKYE